MTEGWKHPNDMDRDELRELVDALSWMGLDLAQHLAFTNDMLKPEFKEEAYKRAAAMAYELSSFPWEGPKGEIPEFPGLAIFGEKGIGGWT